MLNLFGVRKFVNEFLEEWPIVFMDDYRAEEWLLENKGQRQEVHPVIEPHPSMETALTMPYATDTSELFNDGEDDQGGIIEAIPKDRAQDLLEIIRSGMQEQSNRKSAPSKNQRPSSELIESKEYTLPANQPISVADEIRKLANLREEGLIIEEEFKQMKQDLLRKNDS